MSRPSRRTSTMNSLNAADALINRRWRRSRRPSVGLWISEAAIGGRLPNRLLTCPAQPLQGNHQAVARAADVTLAADMFHYMAGWATKIEGNTINISVPYMPGANRSEEHTSEL